MGFEATKLVTPLDAEDENEESSWARRRTFCSQFEDGVYEQWVEAGPEGVGEAIVEQAQEYVVDVGASEIWRDV